MPTTYNVRCTICFCKSCRNNWKPILISYIYFHISQNFQPILHPHCTTTITILKKYLIFRTSTAVMCTISMINLNNMIWYRYLPTALILCTDFLKWIIPAWFDSDFFWCTTHTFGTVFKANIDYDIYYNYFISLECLQNVFLLQKLWK